MCQERTQDDLLKAVITYTVFVQIFLFCFFSLLFFFPPSQSGLIKKHQKQLQKTAHVTIAQRSLTDYLMEEGVFKAAFTLH
ncbi:hypothetical protein GDO78_001022 [Eleutherodactylus coqui]|uniref:Uncharacterized protein n=1 Tax=Eleutherodactylus coqui TaxID=57060 RepID=A0A8J6FRK6_ELECQ|nr:hypothetical protein GDO78_001022 [Eleutherodactylus coqui]